MRPEDQIGKPVVLAQLHGNVAAAIAICRNARTIDHSERNVQRHRQSHADAQDNPAIRDRIKRCLRRCISKTDQQSDGVSMIYSFYNPDMEERGGLGNFIIMDHILRAKAAGLPYVYLGYWVNGAARMQYKTRYQPLERLGPDGWELFDPDAEG